jgi:hypothetical protein
MCSRSQACTIGSTSVVGAMNGSSTARSATL